MMFQIRAAIAAAVLIVALPSYAQTGAEHHFASFQAALDRNDRAAAEAALVAGLAAVGTQPSSSRAALLANLAQLRIDSGRLAEALEPARETLTIAERGNASGIDPAYARLLVGQAELASNGDAGLRRILAALQQARANTSISIEAYQAAIAAGDWAIANDRQREALQAYDEAIGFITGEDADANALKARAILGRGIARNALEGAVSERRRTGTRLANSPGHEISDIFAEAVALSRPAAERDARTGRLTRAQMTYGAALAWANDRNYGVRRRGWSDSIERSLLTGFAVPIGGDGGALCRPSLTASPPPTLGLENVQPNAGSTVVVRITTDSTGSVADRRVVGAVGGAEFLASINAVLPQWGVTTRCDGARVEFVPVIVTTVADFEAGSGTARAAAPRFGQTVGRDVSGAVPAGNLRVHAADLVAHVVTD